MRRTDLTEATMEGWARLDAAQRQRFFEALRQMSRVFEWSNSAMRDSISSIGRERPPMYSAQKWLRQS